MYSETIIRNPITLRLCHCQQLPLVDPTLSENRFQSQLEKLHHLRPPMTCMFANKHGKDQRQELQVEGR